MKKLTGLQIAGLVLSGLQFIATAWLLIQVLVMNFLPTKWWLLLGAGLLLDFLVVLVFQLERHVLHWLGKLISIITIIGIIVALFSMKTAETVIEDANKNTDIQSNIVYVIVKKDSSYQTLQDVKDARWGVQYTQDKEFMYKAVDAVKAELNHNIDLSAYDNYNLLYPDLMDETVDVMFIGAEYLTIIDEFTQEDSDPYTFSEEVRILTSYEFEEEIPTESESETEAPHKFDITKDTFTLFISGIDTYGDISTKSRSDVNILMTINPTTKQILMVTTPRDAWINIPGVSGDNGRDKLTHSGIYGIDCTIDTIESIYDVKVNYYARVNFSSVEKIIDALGGVNVYSAYTFSLGEMSFKEGYNQMDGKTALRFARERHSFASGDFQRGRNQMEVVKAIIRKCCSKQILKSYKKILNVVSKNTQTNVKTKEIYQLVKMQLSDNASWEMFSFETSATVGREYCYSYPWKSLSVSKLISSSVEQATDAMKKMQEGKKLKGADVAQ